MVKKFKLPNLQLPRCHMEWLLKLKIAHCMLFLETLIRLL